VGGVEAQCPNCTNNCSIDAQAIPLNVSITINPDFPDDLTFEVSLCKSHSLHNTVVFKGSVPNDRKLFCTPGDGTPDFEIVNGSTSHTYPIKDTNKNYTVSFSLTDLSGNGLASANGGTLTLKAIFPANDANFSLPDETWEISTSTAFTLPFTDAFPSGSQYNTGAPSTASAYIKYAPSHNGKLLKPLIFVDGVDFDETNYTVDGKVIRHGNTGWDVLTLGNDASKPSNSDNTSSSVFAYFPTAFNRASEEEYDVIYLDFASGSDWIEKNGLLLVELINRVNVQREKNAREGYPVCESAVVGASMGGQVSKWALSYMETHNMPHFVHTYVSFDSPQKGAHIPIGIQGFAFAMNKAGLDKDNLWGRLNNPAARQMLVSNLGAASETGKITVDLRNLNLCDGQNLIDPLDFGFTHSNDIRENFKTQMSTLGYPKDARSIAISCGTNNGTKLPFADGAIMLKAAFDPNPNNAVCNVNGNVFSAELAAIGGADIGLDGLFFCNTQPGLSCSSFDLPPVSKTLFKAYIPTGFDVFLGNSVPSLFKMLTITDNGVLPAFDNAPGCRRGDLFSIEDALSADPDNTIPVVTNVGYTTFMPTVSLMDLNWTMDNQNLIKPININDEISLGNTPFSAIYAPQENLRHIELTEEMTTWMLSQLTTQLSSNSALNLASGQSYNYGKRKFRVPNTDVVGGSVLGINLKGTINYMTPQDPQADENDFHAYTGASCGSGALVTVEKGGTLQLGEPSLGYKNGFLHVTAGSTVHVRTDGILRVSNLSQLLVEKGAFLILDKDALIILANPEAKIRIEGTLVINGDIQFTGPGYFEFAQDNTLEIAESVGVFRLDGQGGRFIRIAEGATLEVPENRGIQLSNGNVHYSGGSTLLINTQSSGQFNQVFFLAKESGGDFGIIGKEMGDLRVEYCYFGDITYPVQIYQGSLLAATYFNNTTFAYYSEGVKVVQRGALVFDNCTLSGYNHDYNFHDPLDIDNGTAQYGIRSEYNFILLLNGCKIEGHKQVFSSSNIVKFTTNPLNPVIPARSAVEIEGGWLCWMRAGELLNNDYGISNRDFFMGKGFPTNVILQDNAIIRNGYAGVVMKGNRYIGSVTMDCARIINQRYCIAGEDIRLMIDATLLNHNNGLVASPNTFIISKHQSSKFLRVHYQLLANPTNPVPALNNFWGIVSGSYGQSALFAPIVPSNVELKNIAIVPNINLGLTVESTGSLIPSEPREACLYDERIPCEDPTSISCYGDCPFEQEGWGSPTTVKKRFLEGYDKIQAGDYQTAKLIFAATATADDGEQFRTKEICKSFQQTAESLSQAGGGLSLQGGTPQERSNLQTDPNLARIYPNPSIDQVEIVLPTSKDYLVKIINTYGQVVKTYTSAKDHIKLDVSSWNSGVYSIELEAMDGKTRRQQLKMLVQH
jgi:hypothetical protein